jgi:hypothetical protein
MCFGSSKRLGQNPVRLYIDASPCFGPVVSAIQLPELISTRRRVTRLASAVSIAPEEAEAVGDALGLHGRKRVASTVLTTGS